MDMHEVARVTSDNARRVFGVEGREADLDGRVVYAYGDALYLNITNRCTLACRFCLKHSGYDLAGQSLALQREPTAAEVIAELEAELAHWQSEEVVFCGIGEPLLRPEVVVEVSRYLKSRRRCVRVNTDGLANLVHGRDVVAELAGLVDAVSVSLNAADAGTYARLCPSLHGERAFEAVCNFIRRCGELLDDVTATVVRQPQVDIGAARRLAASLGATFRVRG